MSIGEILKRLVNGMFRAVKNACLGMTESIQDTYEEIKDGQIKMVTSDSRSRNKKNFIDSTQIYSVKYLSCMLQDKINLFKDKIIILDEISSECYNFCLNNDLNIYEIESDIVDDVSIEIEIKDANKITFLNENKKFLALEILDSNKNILNLVSTTNLNGNYFILVKDVMKCYHLTSELKQHLVNDINFTLQNIYQYNDMLSDLDNVTLEFLNNCIEDSIKFINSAWIKAQFYENLYAQLSECIVERIEAFNNDEEKAFSSKKLKVFTVKNEFNIKKILTNEQNRLIYKYDFNEKENIFNIYIPIYRLRETINLIEKAQNNLSDEILDKIEPIGECINVKY